MDIASNNMINLKWTDIEKAVSQKAIVLMPLGVIEEHGPHLCLGTDIYTAQVVCSSIQEKLAAQGVEAIIAPPFYWGICQSTRGFIGSFNIRMETAQNLVLDILHSLHDFGFTEIFGINAHGDIEQNVLFMNSFREARERFGVRASYCFRREVMHFYGLKGDEPFICPIDPQEITTSRVEEIDVHAGDVETAIINAYYEKYADTDIAERLPPITLEPGREMEWLTGGNAKQLSENGYVGNPARYADVQLDRHMDDLTERYVRAIIDSRHRSAE